MKTTVLAIALMLSMVTFSQTKIYPNPSNGEINIVLEDPLQDSIETKIIDMNGKLVNNYFIRSQDNMFKLNTTISSGVYILQIITKDIVENKKIIIK